jgi:hypothetical protein
VMRGIMNDEGRRYIDHAEEARHDPRSRPA